MIALLIFSVTLLVAMLWSELVDRTVLSTAVLFLAVGAITGQGTHWIRLTPANVSTLAHYALVSVLFTDSMQLGLRELREAWRLPGRALLLGMPLTFLATSAAAHWLVHLQWVPALLTGAVLSPTDPVFASAIVGRGEIPRRLRLLLNVESGVNDALALPAVVILVRILEHGPGSIAHVLASLGMGLVIGCGVPIVALLLERTPGASVLGARLSLFTLAIGLVVMALSDALGANTYLAAFSAGLTITALRPQLRDAFHESGENIVELLKLAALLAFAALIRMDAFAKFSGGALMFAIFALFVARPLGLLLALVRSGMPWPERITAAWFGPKGFASVVFGLLVIQAGVPDATVVFALVALVIVGSIVAHSSTDVLIARWFQRGAAAAPDRQ